MSYLCFLSKNMIHGYKTQQIMEKEPLKNKLFLDLKFSQIVINFQKWG